MSTPLIIKPISKDKLRNFTISTDSNNIPICVNYFDTPKVDLGSIKRDGTIRIFCGTNRQVMFIPKGKYPNENGWLEFRLCELYSNPEWVKVGAKVRNKIRLFTFPNTIHENTLGKIVYVNGNVVGVDFGDGITQELSSRNLEFVKEPSETLNKVLMFEPFDDVSSDITIEMGEEA